MLGDLVHFLCLGLRSRASLVAENLFLRKQLAFYQERKVKPRRADNPTCVWRIADSCGNQEFATHRRRERGARVGHARGRCLRQPFVGRAPVC